MTKLVFGLVVLFSVVSWAEEFNNFPARVTTNDKSCAQLQQSMANRGFLCSQSSWFPTWCTMYVMSPSQCDAKHYGNVAYAASQDECFCRLGFVCMKRKDAGP